MKDPLGFAVLTGPLWLIFLLFIFGSWLGFKVTKLFKSVPSKVAAGVGTFALVLILPFGDEIAGRIYLNHLCTTEAGVKVYHTVELPAEYWDEHGRPKFLNVRGVLIAGALNGRFKWHSFDEPYVSTFIAIDKRRWFLRDTQSEKDLGEKITFVRHYGWANRFSPAPAVGESCRDVWAKK